MANSRNGLNSTQYLDERRLLIEGENDVAARFDKGLLSLSGGALLLSLTFLKDFAGKAPDESWAILIAWIMFGVAIAAMLFSLLTSQSAYRRQRDILGDGKGEQRDETNDYAKWTQYLNVLSILLFVGGAGFLVYFVCKNMPQE